ncbi:ATP-binding protein [Actinoplanes sp. NPDC049681]|uniref:ATP-binding protein n=1 Tax=Actinoplanes sp. NPDC049681 TaxID=3363905 RepID=UPI0037A1E4D5
MDSGLSPILLQRHLSDDDRTVTVIADVDTAIVEVTVSGRWDRRLREASSRVLRGCLAAHPAAIIMDLHDLNDPSGASVAGWRSARRWGEGMHDSVPVVACLPTQAPLAGALRSGGRRRDLPIYTSVPQARTALITDGATTGRSQLRLRLAPELAEAVRARRLVNDACTRWQPAELEVPARLVISELVLNAIQHAATTLDVTVTRLPSGVHLAVYDGDPRLPRLRRSGRKPGDITESGLGLRVLHHAATAWGALPTNAGKMVWATIIGHQLRHEGRTTGLRPTDRETSGRDDPRAPPSADETAHD